MKETKSRANSGATIRVRKKQSSGVIATADPLKKEVQAWLDAGWSQDDGPVSKNKSTANQEN